MPTNRHGFGLAEPPEGVTAGDDVPRENEQQEQRHADIQRVYRTLRAQHDDSVDDATLRSKARNFVDRRED